MTSAVVKSEWVGHGLKTPHCLRRRRGRPATKSKNWAAADNPRPSPVHLRRRPAAAGWQTTSSALAVGAPQLLRELERRPTVARGA